MGACYWARIDRIFYATTAKDVKVGCRSIMLRFDSVISTLSARLKNFEWEFGDLVCCCSSCSGEGEAAHQLIPTGNLRQQMSMYLLL
jgi:tRNA(Arg) A34 adenosine deaminase TadA